MANRAGLKKVTKTVRGKKGVVKRSYWVRAKEGVKNFVKKHPTAVKVGLGAAGALAAGLAIRKGIRLDRRVAASKQQTYDAVMKAKEAIGTARKTSEDNATRLDRAQRQRDAESRRIKSMDRRVSAAAARASRGDHSGAVNILMRQSHLNRKRKGANKPN